MRKKQPFNVQSIIVFSAYGFALMAIGVLLGLQFAPDLLRGHIVPSVAKYYVEVVPHLEQDLSRVSLHIVGGMVLLVTMLMQINTRLHRRFPFLHRLVGAIYMIVGACVAGSGMLLAENVIGGITARAATYTFGVIWFLTAFKSMYHVWRNEIRLHKRWTACSCFATLATGFMRPAGIMLGLIFPKVAPDILFAASNWLAIVFTLALCWWYVKKIETPMKKEISKPKPLARLG